MCTNAYHESLKVSRKGFRAATERLPHHQHAEAIGGGLWYRNCLRCGSTICWSIHHEARAVA